MIKKLYISHRLYDWNKSEFSELDLLERKNLNFYQSSATNYNLRTSLEDLSLKLEEMESFINSVEEIYLIDLELESLDNQYNYYNFMRLAMETNLQDHLFNKDLYKSQHDPRTDNKTLYIAGCSMSYGTGIKDSERYGEILSQKLGLPCIFLAMPGSSIAWQADQILQTDLRSNDIVVWGLTSLSRVNIANSTELIGYTINNYAALVEQKYFNLDYFDSWTLTLSCIKQILQVENVCQQLGVNLYLANLLETTVVPLLFARQSNYINCLEEWKPGHDGKLNYLDLGTDNIHPGPKQHQVYADKIYQNIMSQTN
jgi:hypothetical protein